MKNAKCPVCDTDLSARIPDFCPTCGWECGTDITLYPSLNQPTDSELEYHREKLYLARERWITTQKMILGQTERISELERQLGEAKIPRAISSSPDMVVVEGGSFLMGSNDLDNEQSVNRVELVSFYMGKFEVTQEQWMSVIGSNPSHFVGDKLPVENVSWFNAVEFCNRLSRLEGLQPCYSLFGESDPESWNLAFMNEVNCDMSASGYRLPTEVEWEYAARGGIKSKEYIYSGGSDLDVVAWYDRNSEGSTHPVGEKEANELGIYDMSGNVWEWCWDWYDRSHSSRIIRGGSWGSNDFCRAFHRGEWNPGCSDHYGGFRVARTI